MFVDTNIIVDLIRNKAESKTFFKNYAGVTKTSVITRLELIDGLRTKNEIGPLNKYVFNALQIEIIYIDKEISQKAEEIFANFRHSNGISINDAIIASTALIIGEPIATHNTKHFSFIPNLKLLKPY